MNRESRINHLSQYLKFESYLRLVSEIIDLNLLKKLINLGAIKSLRAVHYKGFVINEFYLSSDFDLINYCSEYAFDKKKDKEKRKVALELATLILNNYSK